MTECALCGVTPGDMPPDLVVFGTFSSNLVNDTFDGVELDEDTSVTLCDGCHATLDHVQKKRSEGGDR